MFHLPPTPLKPFTEAGFRVEDASSTQLSAPEKDLRGVGGRWRYK